MNWKQCPKDLLRVVAIAAVTTSLVVLAGCKTYGGTNPTGGKSGDSTNPTGTSGDDAK